MELNKDDILKTLFSSGEVKMKDMLDEIKITMLPIELVDPLTSLEHPFEKSVDYNLEELAEKIKLSGVLEPIIVRPNGKRYEVLAGHRRRKASILAGLKEIPAIVRTLDDEEATIVLTDTNLGQREHIFPSERAKAYQMQLDVLRSQGKRKDLIEGIEKEERKKSRDILAEHYQVSPRTISNYIRLNLLIDEMLNFVDEEQIALQTGVSVSYLNQEQQTSLFQIIKDHPQMLTKEKADLLKESVAENDLSDEEIMILMGIGKRTKSNGVKPVYQTALKKVEQYCKKMDREDLERLARCNEYEIIETVKEALQALLKRNEEFFA